MNLHERELLMKHERALFGTEPDNSDGLVSIVSMHSTALHGTNHNPGGLVQAVDKLTKAMYVASGFLFASQVGWILFTYFFKK